MPVTFMIIAAIIGFFQWGLKGIFFGALFPFGWKFISYLENQVFYLTTIDNFIWWKFLIKPVLALMLGIFCAPFYIGKYLLERYVANESNPS
ncbi:hypothetical protein [Proteiniclasticum ruminis]|uniref:Uncharacterized protein n=1 Tax=Proteiniclasticum ruminis TaxID=398199 RepID=A0A1G8TFH4_9CLOT|nr:hypothetical protein [Proteiniclasticum ruminis]SDJ40157.1 hypothetical protein SAMN05421804_1194 [Proteiniclasticum ruminis]